MFTTDDFVTRLTSLYYPPIRWDEEQEQSWSDTITDELGHFPGAVLERAAKEIIRTRKDKNLPLVSECIGACLEAQRWLKAEENKGKLQLAAEPTANPRTHERHALAISLMRSPVGRQAVKEGWHGPCYHHICRLGEMPRTDAEIKLCKQHAEEHNKLLQEVSGGYFTTPRGVREAYNPELRKALLKWGLDILGRWDSVAKEVRE